MTNDNVIDFSTGDYVVYPAHGVGQIDGIETQTISGMEIKLYNISFEKDRMRLKVPVMKAGNAGLRKLCTEDRLKDAIKTLKGKAKIRRTMWSRRAQEYEMKINSGDPVAIAEVLRDLKRDNEESDVRFTNLHSSVWHVKLLRSKRSLKQKQQSNWKTFWAQSKLLLNLLSKA